MALFERTLVRASLVAVVAITAAAMDSGVLTLSAAVEAAGRRAKQEKLRLDLAQAQVRMLEAMNRTRVDFRPGFSLFSFTNPLLLATSIGSGFSIGKPNAPSPFTLHNAWFEVLEAELAAEKARVRAEGEAVRAYFRLLEKQQLSGRAKSLAASVEGYGLEAERLLREARITELDRLQTSQRILDLKSAAIEAESARRDAAIRLASLTGMEDFERLRVPDETSQPSRDLHQAGKIEAIWGNRGDLRLLRDRAGDLRRMKARRSPGNVQVGFGRVSGVRGSRAAANNFLLGGNTGRIDFNLGFPLTRTGEKEAANEVLDVRLKMIEAEIERLEQDVRTELMTLRSAAAAAEERAGLAHQRWLNASKARELIAARVDAGLESRPALLSGDLAAFEAYAGHLAAGYLYQSYLRIINAPAEPPAAGEGGSGE